AAPIVVRAPAAPWAEAHAANTIKTDKIKISLLAVLISYLQISHPEFRERSFACPAIILAKNFLTNVSLVYSLRIGGNKDNIFAICNTHYLCTEQQNPAKHYRGLRGSTWKTR